MLVCMINDGNQFISLKIFQYEHKKSDENRLLFNLFVPNAPFLYPRFSTQGFLMFSVDRERVH